MGAIWHFGQLIGQSTVMLPGSSGTVSRARLCLTAGGADKVPVALIEGADKVPVGFMRRPSTAGAGP